MRRTLFARGRRGGADIGHARVRAVDVHADIGVGRRRRHRHDRRSVLVAHDPLRGIPGLAVASVLLGALDVRGLGRRHGLVDLDLEFGDGRVLARLDVGLAMRVDVFDDELAHGEEIVREDGGHGLEEILAKVARLKRLDSQVVQRQLERVRELVLGLE